MYKYLILFLFLFFLKGCFASLTFTDLTIDERNQVYAEDLYCSFNFKIQTNEDATLQTVTAENLNFYHNETIGLQHKILVQVSINNPIRNSDIIFTFENSLSVKFNFTKQMLCEGPPSFMDIEVLNNGNIYYDTTNSLSYPSIIGIKIKNFKKKISIFLQSSTYSDNVKFNYNLGFIPNIYLFILTNISSPSSWTTPMQVNIAAGLSNTSVGSFSVKPLGSGNNIGTLIGDDYGPIISDQYITSFNRIFYFLEFKFQKNQRVYSFFFDSQNKYPLRPTICMGNLTNPVYLLSFPISTYLDPVFLSFLHNGNQGESTFGISTKFIENKKYFYSANESITSSVNVTSFEFFTNYTSDIFQFKYTDANVIPNVMTFPYGYSQGTSSFHKRKYSVLRPLQGANTKLTAVVDPLNIQNTTLTIATNMDTTAPVIKSVEYKKLGNTTYHLVRMNIIDDNIGFMSMDGYGDYTKLVQGTPKDGYYEFVLNILDFLVFSTINVCDSLKNCRMDASLTIDSFVLQLPQIKNITFKYNSVDVSNCDANNFMYIYTTVKDPTINPSLIVSLNTLNSNYKSKGYDQYIGAWDEKRGCYSIPFKVKKNTIPGEFNYILTTSDSSIGNAMVSVLFNSTLLVNSYYGDIIGPIVTNLKLGSPTYAVTTSQPVYIDWTITIQDKGNGFRLGKASFTGTRDFVRYNTTFDRGDRVAGDIFTGSYVLKVKVDPLCSSQSFYLSYLYLEDELGFYSTYDSSIIESVVDSLYKVYFNPLYKFYNVTLDSLIQVECTNGLTDTSPPILESFSFYPEIINVYSNQRVVTFTFTTLDDTGFNLNSNPRVYIHSNQFEIEYAESKLVNSYNSKKLVYECKFTLPYGFGRGHDLIGISLFGIVDVQGNFNGYSMEDLKEAGFINMIKVQSNPIKDVVLFKSSPIYSNGGDVVLDGISFNPIDNDYLIILNYFNGTIQNISPIAVTNSSILFNIPFTITTSIVYIMVQDVHLIESNTIAVNVIQSIIDDYSDLESLSSSSDQVLPTNAPQQCLNQCSGNGKCTNSGCVCTSPWIGLDCSSKIIAIDPPKLNNTNPGTNITVPKDQTVLYAIISVVAVNELDNDGNIVY
ncbi:hypothetical protein CYY_009976, partial [Polysphondylium violaceum]